MMPTGAIPGTSSIPFGPQFAMSSGEPYSSPGVAQSVVQRARASETPRGVQAYDATVHNEAGPVFGLHLLLHEDPRTPSGGGRYPVLLSGVASHRSPDDYDVGGTWVYREGCAPRLAGALRRTPSAIHSPVVDEGSVARFGVRRRNGHSGFWASASGIQFGFAH